MKPHLCLWMQLFVFGTGVWTHTREDAVGAELVKGRLSRLTQRAKSSQRF